MEIIQVNINEKEYKVYIGNEIIKEINNIFKENGIKKDLFVITDKNVADIYYDNFLQCLEGFNINSYILEPGENTKNINTASDIYIKMIENGCNRNTTIVSLGGGVVGDIAGFVASTYMRGVNFIQIPTTLLSQVDSSIGGKVAVNLKGYKNIVGSFYQPKVVVIDVSFLNTLCNRDFFSGLGEVFKYGLISNYEFFYWLDKNCIDILDLKVDRLLEIVKQSVSIKKSIVEQDEKDFGIRRILNFGHTIGHGIESIDNFNKFTHGESITLGMIYESYIAKEMNLINNDYFIEISKVLGKIIKPIKFTDEEIMYITERISHDKKNIGEKPVFILPVEKGLVKVFEDVNERLIVKSLEEGFKWR